MHDTKYQNKISFAAAVFLLKSFSFPCLFWHVVSLIQLAGSLHIGHASISLVLIIGFLYVPAMSNDQDF